MRTRKIHYVRRSTAAAITILTATTTMVAAGSGIASAAPVTPPGMTVLLDSGAWSWFEDERAIVDFAGNRLYVSAVASSPAIEVVVGEINLASGDRRLIGLGESRRDDHNSAAIWESPQGEVLTAWSGHAADTLIRPHRRRTDGSWLRLPRVSDNSHVTYNNLYSVLSEDGSALLYDFYRGSGRDPEAIASNDAGRTWSSVGRVLRDPIDDNSRPYLRYTSRGDRIDLIATEGHPDEYRSPTSIYHGYILDGIVYTSAGVPLGRIGTAIPVTALTRIWPATSTEEGWTVDIGYDPATGYPIAAFSTYRSVNDHRYYIGRWDGSSWQTRQIAFAGTALYSGQRNYTGLVALDPRDADHVVISTDADPVTGAALVSTTDGERHHELFDGRRQPDGSYAWTALTANSTDDNIRPVITTSAGGAWALAWLRGRYSTFTNYSMRVVGLVQRSNGSLVDTSPSAPRRPVVPGIDDPGYLGTTAVPLAGDFDSHPAGDVLMYRAGGSRDDLVIGDDGRHPIHVRPPSVNGTYRPITGDFDGDGDTDVFWYAPGDGRDIVWLSQPTGSFTSLATPPISGTYRPVPGDYDADGDTDLLWYAPGRAHDYLWTSGPDLTWTSTLAPTVNGTYAVTPGDYDADGDTDLLWYRSGTDYLWVTGPGPSWTSTLAPAVNAVTGIPGDYDADGDTDIFWYGTGTAPDQLWITDPGLTWVSTPKTVNGTYRPAAHDFDDDGADDILWYRPGSGADYIWYHSDIPVGTSQRLNLNL
jgi:putative BNR repeat neuraminidase/VCBS repeat protein